MKIVALDRVEKKQVVMDGAQNAFKQVPISAKDGAPMFAVRVFTLGPGGHTPYHSHPFEHVNYVIEGDGVLLDEKGKKSRLNKNDFALILPNEKHQYRNEGDKPFVMICAVPKAYE